MARGFLEFRIPKGISTELRQHLEDRIIFGEIPAGARLVEEEVVRDYDVSRSPVREALRMLEQDGLLVRESRRGLRVGKLTISDLDEVYSCRLALECIAAEQAAHNRTETDLAELHRALDAMAAAQPDRQAFFRANLHLSGCIYESTHNRTLIRLLQSIGKQAMRYRYYAYTADETLVSASVRSNRAIIEAIEACNPAHSSALTKDVITNAWNSVRSALQRSEAAEQAAAIPPA